MKQVVTVPNGILLAEVTRLLDEGHDVCLMTKGNSMLPFIIGGRDSVVLRKFDTVETGDIVLARLSADRYVLHRVIAIDGQMVTLMGDGNIHGTESCTKEAICGTAVAIVDGKGVSRGCRGGSHGRKARLWKALLPVRRYLLAIMRRTIFKNKIQK